MQTTTPETDVFTTSFTSIDDPKGKKQWVPSDFARVLERERDEARNKMADALQEVDLRTLDFERMKQERDGLQDILQKLIGIIPELECNDFGHKKEEQHSLFEKCPVLERYDAIIKQAKTILEKA